MNTPKPEKFEQKHQQEFLEDKENWLESTNPIFASRDEKINAILEPDTFSQTQKEINQSSQFDKQLTNNPPFPAENGLKYEAKVNKNIEEDEIERLIEDEKDELSLDWNGEGEVYQLSFNETIPLSNSPNNNINSINKDNLSLTNLEENLLTIHTIIYRDPSGEDYLLHWDPGRFTPENRKEKYVEENNKPHPLKPLENNEKHKDKLYEDNSNQKLVEGLETIYEEVNHMSQKLYTQATKNMEKQKTGSLKDKNTTYDEKTLETVWNAERWRAMAESVKTFTELYKKRS